MNANTPVSQNNGGRSSGSLNSYCLIAMAAAKMLNSLHLWCPNQQVGVRLEQGGTEPLCAMCGRPMQVEGRLLTKFRHLV